MANPRKFSEKIALHNQKQAEETAAFEKIMREVSDATNKVNPSSRQTRIKAPPKAVEITDSSLQPIQQCLGTFRSGSLPNVAAPQTIATKLENLKPEDGPMVSPYGLGGGHSGGTSPSRSPSQRGRASSSVGPMRRPADRKHDTSPYGSNVYLSPPPDSNWRRTNSDSALHQSCGGEQQVTTQPLSPHHPLHSHGHPHLHPHQNHRRAADMHLNVLGNLGMNPTNRPRSSCEIPRIPNNNNVYESGGDGGGGGNCVPGGGLVCGDLQVPGGSLPDLTSVHFPHLPPHHLPHRTSPDYHHNRYSPASAGGGSASPASGSPGAGSGGSGTSGGGSIHAHHDPLTDPHVSLYDTQNHLSVPNTNNYLHHNKNMSPLDHGWIASGYQSHCSPPSQYSSTSNINIPSPTMVHSPGSPVESPQTDYSLHQALLQPFEQITMDWAQLVQSLVESGWTAHVQVAENLDQPVTNYNTNYINHSSPHSPQTTNNQHTYSQCAHSGSGVGDARHGARDPVPGGGAFPPLQPLASPSAPATPATPASIPDIILTDYSGELDPGIFGGEEAQLRAGLDLDDLSLLEEPSALLPDSEVEHEFRLDRL